MCRLALGAGSIDAASFTSIRLGTGALALLALVILRGRLRLRGDWIPPAMLFVYAIAFSFAYLELSVGTGALILFGLVQITMLGWGIAKGEKPPAREWVGLIAAFAGLVYLVSPGLHAPSVRGAVLMAAAGVAWGVYSLRGRGTTDPVGQTARNFFWAAIPALAVSVATRGAAHATERGFWLATTSGVLTSGLGYVFWYAALPGLTAARAALSQLAPPLIAAAAGVAFLGEALSIRLLIASVLILGGIALALRARRAR